jgi:hypothetical protein
MFIDNFQKEKNIPLQLPRRNIWETVSLQLDLQTSAPVISLVERSSSSSGPLAPRIESSESSHGESSSTKSSYASESSGKLKPSARALAVPCPVKKREKTEKTKKEYMFWVKWKWLEGQLHHL